jgi:hypothetical protein
MSTKIIQNVDRLSKTRFWQLVECHEYSLYSGKTFLLVGFRADLFREESERVSELKSLNGTNALPAGALASGAEGIKEAIQGFDDAYVFFLPHLLLPLSLSVCPLRLPRTL